MTKWIIGVVVLVAVAGGAWWYFTQGPSDTDDSAGQTADTAAPDTSDEALIRDSASIDAQLQQLDAEQ